MNDKEQSHLDVARNPGRVEVPELHYDGVNDHHGDEHQDLFKLVRDRMAGRWKYAIPLALALMVAGALGGYFSTGAYYESNALIHVAPKKTPLLHETIETGAIPNFSAYVNSQAALLTSARVRERAINSFGPEQWPYSSRNETLRAMERQITARTERNSELIRISYRADTAQSAQEMLNAILDAYLALYVSVDGDDFNRRMAQLRRIRESVRTQVRQKRAAIEDLISDNEFAVRDFRRLIEDRAIQIQNMEAELARIRSVLAVQGNAVTERDLLVDAGDVDDVDVGELELNAMSSEEMLQAFNVDLRKLEAFDPHFALAAQEQRYAQSRFDRVVDTFRPNHWRYQRAERDLERAQRRYAELLEEAMPRFLQAQSANVSEGGFSLNHVAYLEEEIERLRRETRAMGNTQMTLTQLRDELSELEVEYANVNTRIRQLEVESDSIRAGNISVAAPADRPAAPSTDRRHAMAAVGAMGGLAAGFGIVFLIGTFDRRAYAVRQLQACPLNNRLLGVLPLLSKDDDVESAHVAAYCVHQIRNRIEAVRRSSSSAVIAISSPYEGDGKTSLTLALGASYAASGHRTIILDGDLAGRSLTEQLMLQQQPGLQEAIQGGKLNGEVKQLQMPYLSAIPVGADPNFGSERIRREDLVHIFEQLRKCYDIILVDTGPLFGSVEGVPVASASDAVVLTLRRGRRQSGLEECIEALQTIGVPYLGVVLNYARRQDCDRYVSKSKSSSVNLSYLDESERSAVPINVRANALHHAVMMSSQRTQLHDEE